MARGNKASEGRVARSESGPYGGADYRAAEAKRSGGGSGITMKGIREQLNDATSLESGLVDQAEQIKNMGKNIFSPVTPNELMDKFNSDFGGGASSYNPYYDFSRRQKDVFTDTMSTLNTSVAFRDLLEARGATKGELKTIDDAIERYADRVDTLVQHFDIKEYNYPYGREELVDSLGGEKEVYSDEDRARERKIIESHNEYALYLKNAIQDVIIPSKRGPRNA
jgi:hypothetical protein